MVRENYTAVLLVCNPASGEPEEFYSAEGSLGGDLSLTEEGQLLWQVESVAETFFSPATSSFTIGGACQIFQYTFNPAGSLISREKTDAFVAFRK